MLGIIAAGKIIFLRLRAWGGGGGESARCFCENGANRKKIARLVRMPDLKSWSGTRTGNPLLAPDPVFFWAWQKRKKERRVLLGIPLLVSGAGELNDHPGDYRHRRLHGICPREFTGWRNDRNPVAFRGRYCGRRTEPTIQGDVSGADGSDHSEERHRSHPIKA